MTRQEAKDLAARLTGEVSQRGRDWEFRAATAHDVVRTFTASTKREAVAKRNSLARAMFETAFRDLPQDKVDLRFPGFALKIGFANYPENVA